MQNVNNIKTTRYPLAKAGRRILAKVLDVAIIACLVLGIGFAIFCSDPNFKWGEKLQIAGWRYGLFVTLMAIIFFGLMLLLPRFWNKTIGMKALKLSYFRKDKNKNYVFGLFKHELFIWEIVVIIAFVMGWTLTGLNQLQIDSLLEGASSIFVSKVPDGLDKVCFYVGTTFSCFYSICILFLIAIIIATCITNAKPAFYDKYSSIYVYHKQPISENKIVKKVSKETDTKVPGQLSAESLEEIDNI